jgi:hypothetical protein
MHYPNFSLGLQTFIWGVTSLTLLGVAWINHEQALNQIFLPSDFLEDSLGSL